MPTTYTHYRFGDEARKTLNADSQKAINSYRSLFDFGVHGPDIFFYYKPYKSNEIIKFGNKMHYKPAKEFFAHCKEIYQKHEDKEAMMSYILGFLTHFTLDSMCHSYVDRKKEVSNVTHSKIETQYDMHMMNLDNINSLKFNRADCLHPTVDVAKVISHFFDFDNQTIYSSIKSQKTFMDLLHTPHTIKRSFLKAVLKAVMGKDTEYVDLFIDDEIDDRCKDSNLRLDKLRQKALELYPKLAQNLLNYFEGKEELCEYFDNHFGFRDDYKDIPILSYEDELKYIV